MEFTICYFHLVQSSCSFNHLITSIEFHSNIAHKKRGLPPPTQIKNSDRETSIRLLSTYSRLSFFNRIIWNV